MARSDAAISAIFVSTSPSGSTSALEPRRAAAFISFTRSFIADFSSAVKPSSVFEVDEVFPEDLAADFFGLIGVSLAGSVQSDRRANESLEGLLVDLIALVEIDRAPSAAAEAGVEEARRIRERGAFGEGRLDCALVALAGADQTLVRPDRILPLPFFDD